MPQELLTTFLETKVNSDLSQTSKMCTLSLVINLSKKTIRMKAVSST